MQASRNASRQLGMLARCVAAAMENGSAMSQAELGMAARALATSANAQTNSGRGSSFGANAAGAGALFSLLGLATAGTAFAHGAAKEEAPATEQVHITLPGGFKVELTAPASGDFEFKMSRAAKSSGGLLTDEEAIAKLMEIKKSHPDNLAAKHFSKAYYDSLSAENKKTLIRCLRSGTYNPDSSVGCYAMTPDDYDTLRGFFAPLIAEYHKVPEGAGQPSDWNAPAMDLKALGLGPSSSRVRVGRNLASFPLPGAMTKEQRCEMEEVMSKAYAELSKKKMPNGKPFGGRYYSLTPGRPDSISDAEYKKLVKEHLMFKDMAADPYLNTAGISNDWPYGRGTYISEDRRVSIWCNEEDHLRVTVLCPATTSLNEPFDLLNATLQALESVPGVQFKRSKEFGYVTSCPSNLGTGMRASVMIYLPNLTDDESTEKASKIAKPYGLSVRGSGGEHTPVVGHMVDISPSARFGISEAEILKRLFSGIQAMMAEENKMAKAKGKK